jgi:hypothetical protein
MARSSSPTKGRADPTGDALRSHASQRPLAAVAVWLVVSGVLSGWIAPSFAGAAGDDASPAGPLRTAQSSGPRDRLSRLFALPAALTIIEHQAVEPER